MDNILKLGFMALSAVLVVCIVTFVVGVAIGIHDSVFGISENQDTTTRQKPREKVQSADIVDDLSLFTMSTDAQALFWESVNKDLLPYSSIPAFLVNLKSIHARYPTGTSDVEKVRLAVFETSGKQPRDENKSQSHESSKQPHVEEKSTLSPEAVERIRLYRNSYALLDEELPAFYERLEYIARTYPLDMSDVDIIELAVQNPRRLRIAMTMGRIADWLEKGPGGK